MSTGIQIPIGGDLAPFIAAVQKIKGEVGGMERSIKTSMDSTGRAAQAAGKDFRQIGKEGHSAANEIKKAFGGLGNLLPGGSLTGKLMTFGQSSSAGLSSKARMANMGGMGGMGGITAGMAGAGAVISAAAAPLVGSLAVLDSYAPYDSLVRGLKTLEGTAEATTARLVLLRDVAKLPGLGFEEAVRGDIRLRSAGLSAKTSEAALRAFGNALATVGGGKEELEGVILALTQIASKGKVSAEEINQLAERLPQIRALMKSAFGTADTEVLQKRNLAPVDFIEKLTAEAQKLEKTMGGARNATENFYDAWGRFKNNASEFVLPFASKYVDEWAAGMSAGSAVMESAKKWKGMKTPGLEGKAGKTEEQRIEEKKAEAAAKAKQQAADFENSNKDFWGNLTKQQQANDAIRAEADRIKTYQKLEAEKEKLVREQEAAAKAAERAAIHTAAVNAKRFAEAREAATAATLSPRDNILRKMKNLEAEGPMGEQAAIDAYGSDSTAAADIAERTASYLTLKRQLADLTEPTAGTGAFSSPQVLTTALGRIGGGGMGLTIMPMLAAQKESNGFLRQVADSTKRIAAKITPAKAIV